MGKHTFIASAGRRLNIQPCKFSAGLVRVEILSSDRELMASITVDASTAGVISQAFGIEANSAERVIAWVDGECLRYRDNSGAICRECQELTCDDDCKNRALRLAYQKKYRKKGPAMVQAFADNNGVAPKAGA